MTDGTNTTATFVNAIINNLDIEPVVPETTGDQTAPAGDDPGTGGAEDDLVVGTVDDTVDSATDDATAATDDVAGDPDGGAGDDQPMEATPPANPLADVFGDDYSDDITPDVVKSAVKQAPALKAKISELEATVGRYAEIENLFGDTPLSKKVAAIINQERIIGVDSKPVVDAILNSKDSDLMGDPARTLAVAQVISNPELLKKGITFDELVEAHQEDLKAVGWSEGDDLTGSLKVKVKTAIVDIAAKRDALANAPGSIKDIVSAQSEQNEASRKAVLKKYENLPSETARELVKELQAVGLPADEKTNTSIIQNLLEGMVNNGATDVSADMLKAYARVYAIEQAGGLQKIGEAFAAKVAQEKIVAAKAAKEAEAKKRHNGQPVTRPVAPGATRSSKKTEDFINGLMREGLV